jgi:hypothetical protein
MLSHLRDRSFERIIWVDAVCINQENKQEKEQQIQFMAKIYAQATRVVVWLGVAADNSNQALEEIRIAGGRQSTNSSNNEIIQQAITALLDRPWFQRIWVSEQTFDRVEVNNKAGLGTSRGCRSSTCLDRMWLHRN